MIVIVDYGMGNLGSVLNMLKKVGAKATISSSKDDILNAEKIVLPGVGSFDSGIKHIYERGLLEVLNTKVLKEKTPFLGICLGMQLITKCSEEGKREGFGWIDAKTVRFNFSNYKENLRIPHMGWNTVNIKERNHITNDLGEEPRFYFVHSYHLVCNNKDNVILTTNYGYEFATGIQQDNIYGFQFHPEKSHKFGIKLFDNFCKISDNAKN